MYTKGLGHTLPAICLREAEYESHTGQAQQGLDFESALVEGGAHAYYCGHEHVFQQHRAKGVSHYGCGASGAEIRPRSGLYGGVNSRTDIDWVATAADYGFVAVEVTKSSITTRFVSGDGKIIKEDVVVKNQEGEQHQEEEFKIPVPS
jgi:hypothetical protein